jgi:SAM-dependent methyltransferase
MQHIIERLVSARHWQGRFQRWREKMAGVDFSTVVFPEEIGLDPQRAQLVAPSGNRWLRAVFDEMGICAADAVLDVGCGKGSAMRLMLEFPFFRVDGIEASERIAEIARANFDKLGVSRARVRVMTADAAAFTALDRYNFIYFYNPFSCEVMSSFMANLRESWRRAPRLLTIVYDNPVCHDTVVEGAVFRKADRDYPDETGNRIYVYSTPAPRSAANL